MIEGYFKGKREECPERVPDFIEVGKKLKKES
jgi:hypothetical protein